MAVRGLRLQHRIVIPFAIVALIATAAAALVALSVTSRALQARLQAQLLSAAAVISRSDLALNPAILRNLQEVIDAHIVTFANDGEVAASTAEGHPELTAAARHAVTVAAEGARNGGTVVSTDCGMPCLVAVRSVQGRPGYTVALLAETSALTSATRAVARTIILVAAASGLVMVLVSQAVVRRVTAPLDRLVRFVRELSPSTQRQRTEVGENEVGALAQAFNDMLDRLDKSQEALVRSEKLALAGFIAARVAHDIRNPLSSIKMQTQLLRARLGADPDDDATLTAVLHDIDQVESVIRDLLELARPGELQRESLSINTVLQDALRQLAAQFKHRKIGVNLQLADDLPLVSLDRKRFKQVLLNVLVNASEAMPTGGTVTVASRLDGPAELQVEICDDGIGVDPAALERVFDPFVSTKRDGVGLGLVNAKAVVGAHGGRICLATRQPRGTCATIWIPVPPADRLANNQSSTTAHG
jgi:signal transduction histidine kinase